MIDNRSFPRAGKVAKANVNQQLNIYLFWKDAEQFQFSFFISSEHFFRVDEGRWLRLRRKSFIVETRDETENFQHFFSPRLDEAIE